MEQNNLYNDEFSLNQDFINKYHPNTSGSALNLSLFAQDLYTGIQEISTILKSEKIEKKIIEELSRKLNNMSEDIIPKIVKVGDDISRIEVNQKNDRKLAILAIFVAIVVPIVIEVVKLIF
jgi:hypothetical protein